MRRMAGIVIGIFLFGITPAPLAAQEEGGHVDRIGWFQAKPGMEKQLEEGIAKHMEWHARVKDPWAWEVWQVVAGEKTGWYVGGVFRRKWSDFDSPPVSAAEDSADADTNTRPYIGPVVTEFLEELPAFGRPPSTPGPRKLIAFNVVRVKMGGVGKYLEAVRKTKEALEQTNHPMRYYVERVAYGGQFATFYFVHPVESWAGLARPEPSFAAALTETYGEEETRRILGVFGDTVAEESNMILVYRPDLSYAPEQE